MIFLFIARVNRLIEKSSRSKADFRYSDTEINQYSQKRYDESIPQTTKAARFNQFFLFLFYSTFLFKRLIDKIVIFFLICTWTCLINLFRISKIYFVIRGLIIITMASKSFEKSRFHTGFCNIFVIAKYSTIFGELLFY